MKQPMDLTTPNWNWKFNYSRFGIAWMSRYRWWLYGATPENWFVYGSIYTAMKWKPKSKEVGRCIQLTLLGLQIGIMYKKY